MLVSASASHLPELHTWVAPLVSAYHSRDCSSLQLVSWPRAYRRSGVCLALSDMAVLWGYDRIIHRQRCCMSQKSPRLHVCYLAFCNVSAHFSTDDFAAVRLDVLRSSFFVVARPSSWPRTSSMKLFLCRCGIDTICSRREIGSHRRIFIGR
jgi:hypothetical protein